MARDWYGSTWRAYVPVAKRRNDAHKEVLRLRKQGRVVTPIAIAGSKIATTFWGKAWCTNLESYSDYANRLPRGRSYGRNGSVLHLDILEGKVEAIVRGTRTYTVTIAIKTLPKPRWKTVVDLCSGQVTTIVEMFRARIVDVAPDSLTVEATGTSDKLEALVKMLEPFGVRELVQSGIVALGRGPRSITTSSGRAD